MEPLSPKLFNALQKKLREEERLASTSRPAPWVLMLKYPALGSLDEAVQAAFSYQRGALMRLTLVESLLAALWWART